MMATAMVGGMNELMLLRVESQMRTADLAETAVTLWKAGDRVRVGAMTAAALRKLALALPEATEAPHFERASFRVGKKIFATMTAAGDEAMVRVAPRPRLYALLKAQPDVFFSYGGWTERNGSLGVHLARVDAAQMRELVIASWRHVASKRALAAFDAG